MQLKQKILFFLVFILIIAGLQPAQGLRQSTSSSSTKVEIAFSDIEPIRYNYVPRLSTKLGTKLRSEKILFLQNLNSNEYLTMDLQSNFDKVYLDLSLDTSSAQPGHSLSLRIEVIFKKAVTQDLKLDVSVRQPRTYRINFEKSDYLNFGSLLKLKSIGTINTLPAGPISKITSNAKIKSISVYTYYRFTTTNTFADTFTPLENFWILDQNQYRGVGSVCDFSNGNLLRISPSSELQNPDQHYIVKDSGAMYGKCTITGKFKGVDSNQKIAWLDNIKSRNYGVIWRKASNTKYLDMQAFPGKYRVLYRGFLNQRKPDLAFKFDGKLNLGNSRKSILKLN
jgi:hypothetical protein